MLLILKEFSPAGGVRQPTNRRRKRQNVHFDMTVYRSLDLLQVTYIAWCNELDQLIKIEVKAAIDYRK